MIQRITFSSDIEAHEGQSTDTLCRNTHLSRLDVMQQMAAWDEENHYEVLSIQESQHLSLDADARPFWVKAVVYFRPRTVSR